MSERGRDPSEHEHDHDHDTSEDELQQRVRRASGGEPEAGLRAESESGSRSDRTDRGAAGEGDTPDVVRDEDARAATERVERMQREGKGMGGTSTQGRSDVVDEESIEKATRGEES